MGNSELKVTGKQKTLVDDVWIKAMFRPGVSFTGRWLLQPLSPIHSWNTRWLCLECVLGYLHQILIAYAFEACVSWMKKTCIEYPVCCTKLAFTLECVHVQSCPTLFFFFFLCVCPTLFVAPWAVACQALLSMGFPRQECWSGLPFPPAGDLPNPHVSYIAGGFFTCWAMGD